MALNVQLLGNSELSSAQANHALERKAAACLALLALDGRQSRLRLASLLWPEASEETGRGNLRQLARRLRVVGGMDVLTSSDPIDLSPLVRVDVRQVTTWAAAGEWRRVASCRGALLSGLTYDECEELDQWLALARQRLTWTMAHALSVESSRIEREEGVRSAIPVVLRWLELDPLSEDACRRLMRLHFANGDRGAALQAFEACRAMLRQRLELEPSEETSALAEEMRGIRAISPSPAVRRTRPGIPLSVLRPPMLAGRKLAWNKLKEGFSLGKLLMVKGPAGIGKTRLVQDFSAEQRGYRVRYIECRPGDEALPYIHFVRTWRHDLAMYPERLEKLPVWCQRELARILPELGASPKPITNAEERLRFFCANLEMARANDPETIVVSDDVHHLDPASHELGIYLGMEFMSRKSPLRSISTFRPDELDEGAHALLNSLFASGEAVLVELEPLTEAELHHLLCELDLPAFSRNASRLHHYTGGIPFYVVETLKAWLSCGETADLPDTLTPTDRVRITIERRLERLTPEALTLLRAAAILDGPLRYEFALALVGNDAETLRRAWNELESALLLRNGVAAHELLRNVILSSMPQVEQTRLHERVAYALIDTEANPASIAWHFWKAGQTLRSATYFEKAARWAREMLRPSEALVFEARAAELLTGLKGS